jgi:SUR7/PalI family
MYVFNPVEIFQQQLLIGEEVIVPQSVQDNLTRLTQASHWMFALYMLSAILLFFVALAGLSTLCVRLGSVITTVLSFIALIFITAATLLAQVMFAIYRNAINDTIPVLNVKASLGSTMFGLSWAATVSALAAFVGFLFGICCSAGESGGIRYRRTVHAEKVPIVP